MIASRKAAVCVLVVASLYFPCRASAAANTFDIDVNELDRKAPVAPKKEPQKKPKVQKPKKTPPKPIIYSDGYAKYTVQESDFRTRILAKHLHIPEEELQRLLPEILRLNGISDLSQLELGQTIIVPLPGPKQKGSALPAAPAPPQEAAPPQTEQSQPQPFAPPPAPAPAGRM